MPTASEFRTAARALQRAADALDAEHLQLGTVRDQLSLQSPTHRIKLDQGYTEAAAQVKSIASTARIVADTLLARAAVCERYAADMARYAYQHDYLYATKQIDYEPTRPGRPAWWAEI